MKKTITLFTLAFAALTLHAQDIISSQETVRPNEVKVHFRHYHDDLIINDLSSVYAGGLTGYNHTGTILGPINILKGEEKIVKKFDPIYLTNDARKFARALVFKDDRFGILNSAIKDERIALYMQEFDYNLNKVGDLTELYETSLLIDEESKGWGANVVTQTSDIHYNSKSKTALLVLDVRNTLRRSFITLKTLNDNYEVQSSFTYNGEDEKSSLSLITHKILDNGEVLAVIGESSGGYILSFNLVHLAKDGSSESIVKQILPAKKSIISCQISDNSYDDNVIVTLLSSGTKEDKEQDNGALTAYKFNLKTGDLENQTYGLNRNDLMTGDDNNLQALKEIKTEFLADGSVLFTLIGALQYDQFFRDRSIIIIKVDKDGEFQWLNTIHRNSRAVLHKNTIGYLSFLNEEGDLEIVFNTIKSFIKGDKYSPKKEGNSVYIKLDENVKPVKARINLETGDMEIHPIKLGSSINSFSFHTARETEEVGVYKIMHNKGKDTFISTVDFKDK